MSKKKAVFVCVHNSSRSQIAEAVDVLMHGIEAEIQIERTCNYEIWIYAEIIRSFLPQFMYEAGEGTAAKSG